VPAIADQVLVNLQDAKFERPLPVQQHACPIIASGCSLMATAENGSGKTAAYLVPIISNVLHQRSGWVSAGRSGGDVRQPAAVIVAPAHELVEQIAKAAKMLARETSLRVAVASDDLNSNNQRQWLSQGCDVLVASKDMILQLIAEGKISLEHTETLCLDEADMLLRGEGPQQIASMMACCPSNLQLLIFGAAFHPATRAKAREALLHTENFVDLHVGRVGKQEIEENYYTADCDDDKLRFLECVTRRAAPQTNLPS